MYEFLGHTVLNSNVDSQPEATLSNPRDNYPLFEVHVESALLDIVITDAGTGLPIGRPWVTVAMDRLTKMVSGVYIGFESLGCGAVAACLLDIIRRKERVRESQPSINSEWPTFGVPSRLLLSGGPGSGSASLMEACRQLGIVLVQRPGKTAWNKDESERWFARLHQHAALPIAVAALSDNEGQGDCELSAVASMTLGGLRERILKWIIDDYHVGFREEIGEAPAACWERAFQKHSARPSVRAENLHALLGLADFSAMGSSRERQLSKPAACSTQDFEEYLRTKETTDMHTRPNYPKSSLVAAAALENVGSPSSPLQDIQVYFNYLLELSKLRRGTGRPGLMSMLIGQAASRTAVLMRFCSAHRAIREGGQIEHPVLYVRVPPGSSAKALAKAILEALDVSSPARATEMSPQRMVAASLCQAGVELLILDKAEQLFAGGGNLPGSEVIAWVKAVTDTSLCAVMLSGNPSMWDARRIDARLRRRLFAVRHLEADCAFSETEAEAA